MEPLFYVMAIMGCGDAVATCEEARVEPARYENVAQCQSAMEASLIRNADLAYPTILANCQSNRERLARGRDQRAAG
jgi:hypothetical protein